MKKLRWQLIIIFLTGLVVGALLLIEQPEAPTLVAEPVEGGIYTEALIGTPQRLNPILDYYNPVDRDVDRLIFSGLIKFDDRALPQPDLVESWGISKDGTVYNFELRSNIKWHDGEPLTSEDVLFTIELIQNGDPVIPEDVQTFWNDVEVDALSETTVQFRLPEPFAPFLDYLTFGVLPQHLLGGLTLDQIIDHSFNLSPVGSGPYQFDRLIVENDQITGVVLKSFQDYYLSKPFIEEIVFRYYPDSASALNAYREGLVQGLGVVAPEILEEVLAEPDLSLHTGRSPQLTMVFLNLNNPKVPFLQEEPVRRALLMAINRQGLINKQLNGQAIIADSPILPETWAYFDGTSRVNYDPEGARRLLKEAGYVLTGEDGQVRQKEDVTLSFELIFPDEDFYYGLAEAIQQDWQAVNVQVSLKPVPYEELVNVNLENREYDVALVDLNLSSSPDPDPYPFWDQAQATGGQNYSQWDNRMASEYIEQARITTDYTERARLYNNFQVIFAEELPSLPLYFTVYNYAIDSGVQGVRVGPLFDTSDRFLTIRDWFLVASPTLPTLEPEVP